MNVVVISGKASKQFDKMSLAVQRKARSAVEFLKAGNLDSLHVKQCSKFDGLCVGKLDSKTQILFRRKSEGKVEVVGFE